MHIKQIDELKPSTFKYIESEIYSYHETVKHIELIEYEIEHSTTNNHDENTNVGKNSVRANISPVERKVTALLEHKQLKRMYSITDAIKKIYERLDDDKKKLMNLYYWERPGELTWEGIAKECNIGRMTALRWRKQIVYAIAHELGER
ncbi:transcriptional regulator [Pueribacillus theae]|uniref:transcriptional regulator n=1 Tax=Pueribacillus theae TaxID=2171751 RepID=UPI00140300CA|nr:transcriptional regulator [Pueribacillus theae]